MKSIVAELNAWIATETDAAKMRKKKGDGASGE
jgi:hypothetical protein